MVFTIWLLNYLSTGSNPIKTGDGVALRLIVDKLCIITISCICVFIKAQYIVIGSEIILSKTDLNQGIFATSGLERAWLNCKSEIKMAVINDCSFIENIKKAKCS
ncbi:TPA: hypothetical protein I9307_002270 [Proteus mirabilis]|nr:hypothetical protein AM438_03740 [Proteus mirabilis]HAT4484586.1 hypothetical protein [Proteus mirabilis]HAU5759381.1 hypothetical protein [Proteus mirabilis]